MVDKTMRSRLRYKKHTLPSQQKKTWKQRARLGQLDFTPVAMIGCTTQLCHVFESKMATYKSYPVTSNTARGEQQKLGMTGAL